jgi:hypothetical protein
VPVRWVLIRDPEGGFKTQALLCTDLDADPQKIVRWLVMRWQLEVSFQEVRRHLGFETQRQWSDMAIRRTTPALLGLFSVVTLFAHRRMVQGGCLSAPGGLVPKEASYIRRCARFGAQGAVGPGGADFLRVARTDRHDKSPAGLHGTPNRGGLLRGLNG